MNRWVRLIVVLTLLVMCVACHESDSMVMAMIPTPLAQVSNPMPSVQPQPLAPRRQTTASPLPYEARLVDIRSVNDQIRLDLRYATTNNFLKRQVYPVGRCVLRGAAAQRLSQVQNDLEKRGLGLKVYDCYRPLSVQRQMWQILPDSRYVANPTRGSRHNRGAAVDLTLVDGNGNELEMPTGFDDFSERAHRNYNGGSAQARRNRQILEEAMKKQGFIPLLTEWWHFDAPGWDKFAVLDVPFGAIP